MLPNMYPKSSLAASTRKHVKLGTAGIDLVTQFLIRKPRFKNKWYGAADHDCRGPSRRVLLTMATTPAAGAARLIQTRGWLIEVP